MCNNFNSNTQAVISRKYAIANVISSNKVEFLSEFGLKIQCTKPRVLISRLCLTNKAFSATKLNYLQPVLMTAFFCCLIHQAPTTPLSEKCNSVCKHN